MKVTVPREPILLGFDPVTTSDAKLTAVFADDIARSLWLLTSYGHLIGPDFCDWCLRWSAQIRNTSPLEAESLYSIVRQGPYFHEDYKDVADFMGRLLNAVTGKIPVTYRVILPGSGDERRRNRVMRRLGFLHGLMEKGCKYPFNSLYVRAHFSGMEMRARVLSSVKKTS